jgi:hypothetical protein
MRVNGADWTQKLAHLLDPELPEATPLAAVLDVPRLTFCRGAYYIGVDQRRQRYCFAPNAAEAEYLGRSITKTGPLHGMIRLTITDVRS